MELVLDWLRRSPRGCNILNFLNQIKSFIGIYAITIHMQLQEHAKEES